MPLHKNKDTGRRTTLCSAGEDVYEAWTNQVEWVWTKGVRGGDFVILIVSTRGCFMLHGDKIVSNPSMSDQQRKAYKAELINKAHDNRSDEYGTYKGRAIVFAPGKESTSEADQEAYKFCSDLAKSIYMVSLDNNSRAKLMKIPKAGSSSSANDDEFASIEVTYGPKVEGAKPVIYVNGSEVAW